MRYKYLSKYYEMRSRVYKIEVWIPFRWGFWTTQKKYRTEEQMLQAFSVLKKKDNRLKSKLKWRNEHSEFRMIFPDGRIIES